MAAAGRSLASAPVPESSTTGAAGARGGPQVIPRPPEVSPGGAPPWSVHVGTRPRLDLVSVERSFRPLAVERAMGLADPDLRRSAVAVVLSEDGDGDLDVLLTRRSWGMRTHRGEVAFPGGAVEAGDAFPVGTALREAHEEVRLPPSEVSIVGALDPLTTFTSDRVVIPVVGVSAVATPRLDLVAEPAEVDAILHVGVAELLHPDCYHQELWTWDGGGGRVRHVMHFFELERDTVWGATASMLTQLLGVLLR